MRVLARNPGITAIALITLALVIGANSAIFSLVDTFLLQAPPRVKDPRHLLTVAQSRQGRLLEFTVSLPDYIYYRDHNESFSDLVAHYSTAPLNLVADGIDQEVNGAVVSYNYFTAVGVEPCLGRFFTPEEDATLGRNPVAVLSFRCWQRRFGGDNAILGKTIRINATSFTIIGVAPEGFGGAILRFPNEIWIPTAMAPVGYRWCDVSAPDCTILNVIGRLRPGRTASEAAAEMTALTADLRAARGDRNPFPPLTLASNVGVRLEDQRDTSRLMSMLMVAVALLVLIACANLAGLFLARGIARRKEIGIRLSLGASRRRLIRQLVTESLVLSLAGSAGGLIVAFWARAALMILLAAGAKDPSFYHTSLSPLVIGYSAGLAILVGVLFGLAPALQSTRPGLISSLKGDVWSGRDAGCRLRSGLVIVQVALAMVLAACSGLLWTSIRNVARGAGTEPEHVALLRLRPRLIGYSPSRAQDFTREAIRRLETLPAVRSVSIDNGALGYAWGRGGRLPAWLPGQASPRPEDKLTVYHHEVAPRFFESLGIALQAGRDFNEHDREASARVAVVNRTLAETLWPGQEGVGKTLIVDGVACQIVGVVADAQYRSSVDEARPLVYLAYWQNPFEQQIDSRMCVRVAGDPSVMLPSIRQTIQGVDPDVPITEDLPMIEQVMQEFQSLHLMSNVVLVSGLLALLLAAIGLYGVLSFNVGQRTHEIGIRMALGADAGSVIRMVMRQGLMLAALGLCGGIAAAFAISHVLASFLYGVSPGDVPTVAGAAAALSGVALLASYIPTRPVARLDPAAALRRD
jgi:predicted permease